MKINIVELDGRTNAATKATSSDQCPLVSAVG
jgi:hypothetical protein